MNPNEPSQDNFNLTQINNYPFLSTKLVLGPYQLISKYTFNSIQFNRTISQKVAKIWSTSMNYKHPDIHLNYLINTY